MGSVRIAVVLLVTAAGVASADPQGSSSPSPPAQATTSTPVSHAPLVLTPLALIEIPTPPPVSLRLEAARIASERFQDNWRFPEPGAIIGLDGNAWFVGAGHYRPRTARSAALHGTSIGATMLGEILVGTGSPLAGVGALLTGATLDAAGADADRDAEAAHPKH